MISNSTNRLQISVATLLRGLLSKSKSLLNLVSVIIQVFIVAAFCSLVYTRGDFENISASIYPNSTYLMNSFFSDMVLTPIAAAVVILVFIGSLIKEFVVKNINQKLIINLSILIGFTLLFSALVYGLYSVPLSMN